MNKKVFFIMLLLMVASLAGQAQSAKILIVNATILVHKDVPKAPHASQRPQALGGDYVCLLQPVKEVLLFHRQPQTQAGHEKVAEARMQSIETCKRRSVARRFSIEDMYSSRLSGSTTRSSRS